MSAKAGGGASASSRKHLQNVRVIQRNLVYVVGLSSRCCKEDVRKNDFFGTGRFSNFRCQSIVTGARRTRVGMQKIRGART